MGNEKKLYHVRVVLVCDKKVEGRTSRQAITNYLNDIDDKLDDFTLVCSETTVLK